MVSRICLTVLVLFSFAAFSQPRYYSTGNGKIVDSVGYQNLKASKIEKLKKISGNVVLEEDFIPIRKSKDSTILAYKWNILLGDVANLSAESEAKKRQIGAELPVENLKTLSGERLSLENLKGKPTLLNFWFTSCKPCVEEIPVLNKIRQKYQDRVNFVAVTFNSEKDIQRFLTKTPFDFTLVSSKPLIDLLGLESYPANYFLDQSGVVYKIESGIPYLMNEKQELTLGDGAAFEAILDELLANNFPVNGK